MESDDISRKCEKLSLDEDDGPIERIKGSLQERGEQSLSLSLIGKVITNKVINCEAFKSTISTIWQTKNEVVRGFSISNYLYFEKRLVRIRSQTCSFGGLVGQVKEIDAGESGECVGQFIRIRVLIDITNPLKRGLRVALGDDEKVNEVMIYYERLPNFCYYCGKIGHLVRDCPLNTKKVDLWLTLSGHHCI
ncbi:hypothetical protein Q3G72_031062 [Acer saccharum]|nr:hypothetical protein Q3G72_031062 [Acer saccharum]